MRTPATIVRDRYRDMKKRVERILKTPMPFTAQEYGEWVRQQLQGDFLGCGRCVYCGAPVDLNTLRSEHATPLSRGGEAGFANLLASCDECNRLKGELTAVEFCKLMEFVRELGPAAESDIRERLKTAGGFKRLRYFKNGRGRKQ